MDLLDEVRDRSSAGDYASVIVRPIDIGPANRGSSNMATSAAGGGAGVGSFSRMSSGAGSAGSRNSPLHQGALPHSPTSPMKDPTSGEGGGSSGDHEDGQNILRRDERRPPAFGSSLNLLALEESMENSPQEQQPHVHEVTIGAKNRAKMLGRLSTCLGDLGLNINEAHAFCTTDGFALDVFLVSGWEGTAEELRDIIFRTVPEYLMEQRDNKKATNQGQGTNRNERAAESNENDDGTEAVHPGEEWEIDPAHLVVHEKIASGSFGDLYKGVLSGKDVAIKVLKVGQYQDQANMLREFMQELSVLRKVRHKHIVQLIGACTKPPKLCIVTEFMHGGSVLDYLHRTKGSPNRTRMLLELARGVAEGVDYMHSCNIVHRDLKAANLLLDDQGEVKVADFGVARVQSTGGVMTAETGTYRWMAPEVVAHQQYDCKCDIFSFGITLWELVTNGAVPYAGYTPLQAAVGVVQKGLRPEIPDGCPETLAFAMRACWQQSPVDRPTAAELEKKFAHALSEFDSNPATQASNPQDASKAKQNHVEPTVPVSQKTGLLAQTLNRLGMSPKPNQQQSQSQQQQQQQSRRR